MAFDFYWDKDTSVDKALQEYLTICCADTLKGVYRDIKDAIKNRLNIRYADVRRSSYEYLDDNSVESEGYAPYNPDTPFISGLGYDPKEKMYVDFNYQDSPFPYPEPDSYPDSDPDVVRAVADELESLSRRDEIVHGMNLMGGTGGEVDSDYDGSIAIREGALESVYKAAKYGEERVKKEADRRRYRTTYTDDYGERMSTLYLVHNDWYGDIVCELIGENDRAYYFKFKDGDNVILPKWRVLKGSPRVLRQIPAGEAREKTSYYPGKEINTESGQQFIYKELKDVLLSIQAYLNGDYNTEYMRPVKVGIDYGKGKVFMITDGVEDPNYSNTSYKPRGAKGAYFIYGESGDGELAGTAFVSLPDGVTAYHPSMDSPETRWTVDFRS